MLVPDAVLCTFIIAVGFVFAGLSSSLHQLVTGEPLRFECAPGRGLSVVLNVVVRVFAGPAILMRNAIKGAMRGRPPYWLALSTIIASLWSFMSGIVMLELLVRAGVFA